VYLKGENGNLNNKRDFKFGHQYANMFTNTTKRMTLNERV